MERREALKKMTLAMGGALSASTLTAVLTRCTSKRDLNVPEGLVFLKDHQFKVISAISDRIIPITDTPGALDAKVPEFIDMMLFECYSEDNRKKFSSGLKAFEQQLSGDISDTDDGELENFLTDYEKEVVKNADRKDEGFFIRTVKELTVLGYFTSRPGASETLKYVPVPGRYEPCMPMKDDVAWAV